MLKFNFAPLRLPYNFANDTGIFNYVLVDNKLKVQYYLLHFTGRRYLVETFTTPLTVPVPQDWSIDSDCDFTRYLAGLEQAIRRQMARTGETIPERKANIVKLIQNFKLPANAKTKQVGGNIV